MRISRMEDLGGICPAAEPIDIDLPPFGPAAGPASACSSFSSSPGSSESASMSAPAQNNRASIFPRGSRRPPEFSPPTCTFCSWVAISRGQIEVRNMSSLDDDVCVRQHKSLRLHGGRCRFRQERSESCTRRRHADVTLKMLPSFVIVTFTFCTTAPLGSRTTPPRPPAPCAATKDEETNSS